MNSSNNNKGLNVVLTAQTRTISQAHDPHQTFDSLGDICLKHPGPGVGRGNLAKVSYSLVSVALL
jgi:hypothetical protein